ncbi:BrnT family toxin [Methylobacterium aquaticum]|uniref:BrnT family toxin n=1 Tax=Methylobacterium aquaticum TaxID=270351 RepID=UPI003D180525
MAPTESRSAGRGQLAFWGRAQVVSDGIGWSGQPRALLSDPIFVDTKTMKIVYDESKRQANLAKHGYDFADFGRCFDRESAMEARTRLSETGRPRFNLIGRWNDEIVVLAIVSPLGSEALSLVSLRAASPKERNAYARHLEG